MPEIIHEDEEQALLSYAVMNQPVMNALAAANLLPATLTRVEGPWSGGGSPWGQMLNLIYDMRAANDGGGNHDVE